METAERFCCPAADVLTARLQFAAEDVRVHGAEVNEICIEQHSARPLAPECIMRTDMDAGVLCALSGLFSASWKTIFSFGVHSTVELWVPRDFQGILEISTASGTVQLSGLDGADAAVKTQSGAVRAENSRFGHLHVHAASGKVCVERVAAGKLEVGTKSGEQTLDMVAEGSADLKAVSGRIGVRGQAGDLQIHTYSGAVRAEMEALRSFEAQTKSGNVDLMVLRTSDIGRLRVKTLSGAVRVQLPAGMDLDTQFETVSGYMHADSGTLVRTRGAGIPLDVQTVSGALRIAAAKG